IATMVERRTGSFSMFHISASSSLMWRSNRRSLGTPERYPGAAVPSPGQRIPSLSDAPRDLLHVGAARAPPHNGDFDAFRRRAFRGRSHLPGATEHFVAEHRARREEQRDEDLDAEE